MRTFEQATSEDLLRGEAISLILLSKEHLEDLFFHPDRVGLRYRRDRLLALSKSYPADEQLLIRVALDVWNGSGEAKISELIRGLDFENMSNVLNGLGFLAYRWGDN